MRSNFVGMSQDFLTAPEVVLFTHSYVVNSCTNTERDVQETEWVESNPVVPFLAVFSSDNSVTNPCCDSGESPPIPLEDHRDKESDSEW